MNNQQIKTTQEMKLPHEQGLVYVNTKTKRSSNKAHWSVSFLL